MNPEKYLILVKSEEKTKDILSYDMRDQYVYIVYTSNQEQEYRYSSTDIVIYQEPTITDINKNERVYHNDFPLYQVSRIFDFGPKIRIVDHKGNSYVYDKNSIFVVRDALASNDSKNILKHFTAISRYTHIAGEDKGKEPFLHSQFNKIAFINPNSVLAHYLNRQTIKEHSIKNAGTIYPFRFNLSQKQALEIALHNQISVIQGPPGTGKTQTILNILANLVVMQNKTVAVVSSNNAAVQNVRDKLRAEEYDFLVAALGSAENKNLFFADLPVPNVSSWKSDTDEKTLLNQIQVINSRLYRFDGDRSSESPTPSRFSSVAVRTRTF
ncbi:AAA domain-containing protein [Cohnella herbarum]|uniref:AAA family ATPase n=1 Tax=Cohnella herbarum TaxID=2728023 RepID=A0A7Z2VP12_9BACL|nr:AAA domain-containing protein [Cohnella herbarum]QJD86355.1 AAA family ATPase [Cohnella herbarum]